MHLFTIQKAKEKALLVLISWRKPSSNKKFAAQQLAVSLLAAAMIIVSLIALFLGNLVTKPIMNLAATAQRITEGDLNARAEVETSDEIGDLATAFNAMTAQLRSLFTGLENRIAAEPRPKASI